MHTHVIHCSGHIIQVNLKASLSLLKKIMKVLNVFALIFGLGVAFMPLALCTCPQTPQELHAARLVSIDKAISRFYLNDYTTFYQQSLEAYNETAITHYIEATGIFPPADAISYAGNLVPRLPYNPNPPVRQFPRLDYTQLTVIGDLYRVPQIILTFSGYNSTTNDYDTKFDGSYNMQYYFFDECSDQIRTQVSTVDKDQNDYYVDSNSAQYDVIAACQLAFGACAPTPYLNLTGFTTFQECVDGFSTVEEHGSVCPEAFTSDTVICRVLHAFSALFEPHIHCAHLPFIDSPVCYDRCLPECNGCDENARCTARFVESNIIAEDFDNMMEYSCQCNEGYVGDGHTCVVKNCTSAWQCPTGHPHGVCSIEEGETEGICECASNLRWDGETGECVCREDESIHWDNGTPYCLRNGKCHDRWQCPQDFSSVQCRQFDHPNTFSQGNWCLCNPGYENDGIDSDCVCSSPKQEVWSNVQNGNVCISSDECAEEWHCSYGEHCHIEQGNVIGTCVSS